MLNTVTLSLGKWPESVSFPRNFTTSPTTLRIIKDAKVDLDQILPVSFPEFVLQNNLTSSKKTQAEELYEQDKDRRKLKLKILKEKWINTKSNRSKSLKQNFSTRSSKLFKRQNQLCKRNSSRSFRIVKKIPKKSKSPLIFKAKKSPTKGPTYFDYYNNDHESNTRKKTSYEDQSTQTRRQKTLNGSKFREEYCNSSRSKKKSTRSNLSSTQNLINKLNKLFNKWSELDNKHMQELQQITGINDRQKKRLLKIHQIQKQKLRKEIQQMSANISDQKKKGKHFI